MFIPLQKTALVSIKNGWRPYICATAQSDIN